ncbi:hypothetical protein [Scytonema sp. NUACC26]|uniref:hypothetical protein n=1 Tax=Scytonema sp. NUACC26 TaxID=3140176 RepID=UPI0034DC5EEE
MGASSRYWKIWRINPASEQARHKLFLVPLAQDFYHKQLPHSQNGDVETALYAFFYNQKLEVDDKNRAVAGLCLRCYISEPILKACQKLDNLFGTEKHFTYQDLLPFVLNDDGESLMILDKSGKNQLLLDKSGQAKTASFKFFSLRVLQTYKPESQSRMSLENWAYLQTRQNPELKEFLSEFGFQHLSDWALLNRARPKQLERLSQRERHLVEVFHAVYRRDRQQQRSYQTRRCPDPTNAQQQEMVAQLQQRNVIINDSMELIKELKLVVAQLRQYDIWSHRESIEIQDPETGGYTLRTDLPYESLSELDVEQRELLEFLHEQLQLALLIAIREEVQASLSRLEKSKKYAPLAKQFIPGLKLYYGQGLALKEISSQLRMSSWDQARRILNPGELLNKIRYVTVQKLLEKILHKAKEKGLTQIPPQPDYLTTLSEQIEAFVDEEIFQKASEEIRVGKNRSMDSVYAQQLIQYLEQQ